MADFNPNLHSPRNKYYQVCAILLLALTIQNLQNKIKVDTNDPTSNDIKQILNNTIFSCLIIKQHDSSEVLCK